MLTMVALDPGKTTGYCVGLLKEGKLLLEPGEKEFSLDELYEWLNTACRVSPSANELHVVYEDFQYRNYARMNLDLTPVKMIGIIELMQERYEPFVTFTKQTAATGKSFYSDPRLRELGVYWGHGKGHGRDATRHLLQWLNFGAGSQYVDINTVPMELLGR